MESNTSPKQKKSQKRVDRQARKAEKRKQKELLEKSLERKADKKPVRARFSKKSLPGFLAKNADVIVKWLKEYETLFNLADDYGIQRLDRLPEEKRNLLVQNYIDVSDFITAVEDIMAEEEARKLAGHAPRNDDGQLKTDELDEIAAMPDDENSVDYRDEPEWGGVDLVEDDKKQKIEQPPPNYFEDVKEYVESLTDICPDDQEDEESDN